MATPENEAAPSPMTMYALLAAQPLTNWVIRGAIAPLMQFIVADLSFNPTQKALLLGAFYPGYLVTQVPSGFLIQKYGAKLMLTVNMVGTALATAALPLALSSARPITATWVALTISGMFQGSLIPGHQEMKRNWLPAGAGKAFANRIIGLSLCVHSLLATSLTPFLATRFGEHCHL
jgi:sugar phosphate permease